MHRILIFILALSLHQISYSQSEMGLEQYSYLGTGQPGALVPVAYYKAKSKWYAEARYNYDEVNTFSLYAGRTFSGDRALSYDITPMVGGMAGKTLGGSFALNTELNYGNFNFSSQSQYSIIAATRLDNYFFAWSEVSYQPLHWLYAGLSLQNTHVYRTNGLAEPGLLLGLSYKQWNFPVYTFNPFDNGRYFIIGLNWEVTYKANKKKPVPVLVQNP